MVPVWTGEEYLASTRIRFPNRPARSSRYTDWAIPAASGLGTMIGQGQYLDHKERWDCVVQPIADAPCASCYAGALSKGHYIIGCRLLSTRFGNPILRAEISSSSE